MDYLQLRELYHAGIRGMRWGIRRYQNYDGTLTEEGRRRYNPNYEEHHNTVPTRDEDGNHYYINDQGDRTLYKTRFDQLTDAELTDLNRRIQQENRLAAESSDAYEYKGPKADQALRDASRMAKDIADAIPKGNGKVIKKDYSNLSDQELRNRINRLQLEDSYGKLSGDTKYVKSGSEKAREMLQTFGSVLAIAGSAAGLAYTIRKLREGNDTTNTANHSDILDEDENSLEHHGIKGQKWGIRRFMNPDGTLTAEGRARYGGKTNTNQLSDEELIDLDFGINTISKHKSKELKKEAKKAVLLSTAVGIGTGAPAGIALGILTKSPVTGIAIPLGTMSIAALAGSVSYHKNANLIKYGVPDTPEELYKKQNKTQMSHSDILDVGNFLEHHGILGQKWGVRRFQNPDGSLTEEGKKRYNEDSQKLTDMSTALAELEDLTRQYDLRNAINNNTEILLPKEDKQLWENAYQLFSYLDSKYAKEGISANIKTLEDGTDYVVSSIYDEKLGGTMEYYEPLLYDSNGKKYDEKNRLYNTTKSYNQQIKHSDELMHHGIKGQKWGLRRYQNPDGSLTPEGQVRYGGKTHISELSNEELADLDAANRMADEEERKSENTKKALKIGGIIIGTAVIAAGAAFIASKLSKSKTTEEINRSINIKKTETIEKRKHTLEVNNKFKQEWEMKWGMRYPGKNAAKAIENLIIQNGNNNTANIISKSLFAKHSDVLTDNYLAHHGIKGQKWGVRRYQDQNGNMTAEGKQRYRTNQGTKEIIGNSDSYSKLTGSNRRRYANYGKTSGAKRGFLIGLGTGAAAGAGKTILDTVLNRNNLGSGEYTTNRIVNRFVRNTILGAFGGSVIGTLVGSVAGKKSAQAKLADKGQAYTNELLNTPLDRIVRRH